MPKPRALRSDADAQRVLALAQALGQPIAALDVRTDGVTVHFAQPAPIAARGEGLSFDDYRALKDQGRERPPHRRQ